MSLQPPPPIKIPSHVPPPHKDFFPCPPPPPPIKIPSHVLTPPTTSPHPQVKESQERECVLTLAMLIPVRFSTTKGSFSMMDMISLVSLWAPMSPLPLDTMVIFLALLRGWAISAATWTNKVHATLETPRGTGTNSSWYASSPHSHQDEQFSRYTWNLHSHQNKQCSCYAWNPHSHQDSVHAMLETLIATWTNKVCATLETLIATRTVFMLYLKAS